MAPLLKPGERLDDLEYRGLALIQAPGRAFSADSVLLASFARMKRDARAIDLGAGTGVLATLLSARSGARFTAIDRDEAACDMLLRSAAHNGQAIEVEVLDWREAPKRFGHGAFAYAIANPPYFASTGSPSPDPARAELRAGDADTLPSLLSSAAALLKHGGLLFFSWPAAGLTDALARAAGLEPKRLQLIAAKAGRAPYLALIEAKKGGKPGLTLLPPLDLADEHGRPTRAMAEAYHMDWIDPKGGA